VNRVPDAVLPAAMREKFYWPVRVYYEDTDTLGMVYHANYLKYFERARVEWLRALGVDLPALAEGERTAFVVRELAIDYLKPARLAQELRATVQVKDVRGCYVDLAQSVEEGGETYARGKVRIVYVDIDRGKPAVIPDQIRDKLAE
jgi:acyl-CoA thioester hydrolase